jgi:hypothetical protein
MKTFDEDQARERLTKDMLKTGMERFVEGQELFIKLNDICLEYSEPIINIAIAHLNANAIYHFNESEKELYFEMMKALTLGIQEAVKKVEEDSE